MEEDIFSGEQLSKNWKIYRSRQLWIEQAVFQDFQDIGIDGFSNFEALIILDLMIDRL